MATIYPSGKIIENIDVSKLPRCSVCGKEGEPGGYCTHTAEEMKAYLFKVPFK